MDRCILSMHVDTCHNNWFSDHFGLIVAHLFVFITLCLGVEGLCWGQHARNSQFSLKILSLCTINSFKHQINVWCSLQRLYLVFVFNCSIVFCRNRTKFCFVCQLFFHSQTSSYLPGFPRGYQQIVAPDWFWYISIIYIS